MVETDETMGRILEGHSKRIVALVESLRQLVLAAAPELREEPRIGWGHIVYQKRGVVCAISPYKNHVSLHFSRGTSLSDPKGLLEGRGRALRHVKIRKVGDLRADVLASMVQEAADLDMA